MKKLVWAVSLMLAVATVFSVVTFASDGTYNVNAYSNEGEGSAVSIALGTKYGVRLGINGAFCGVSVRLSTYLNKDSVASVTVRRWDTDYETTVGSEPLASKTFDPVHDNLKHTLEFDELPAGEYLILVQNDNSGLAVWQWKTNSVGKGLVYADGSEVAADLNVTVFFTDETAEPFYEIKPSNPITGDNKAPEEYVPTADDAVVARAANPTTWVATDELGRTLPTYEDVGGPREDRTVALFYWSWHVSQDGGEPLNVQKFTEEHPDAVHDFNNPAWPKRSTVHFWNESVFGFYKTNDKWVLRKHAEMLANAGVDVIFFDNTNGQMTFRDSYKFIFETFEEALEDGVDVPKISFLLPFWDDEHHNTDAQLRSIYQDIFLKNKYQKLWFYWDGKPMVMAHQSYVQTGDLLGKEIRKFFTFRGGQPGYLIGRTTSNEWGWLSTYPQALYYSKSDKKTVEQMSVGVAVNHNTKTHELTAMNGENVIGRTYTSKGYDTRENAVKLGANFAEQFEYALEVDPRVIFVTGWNEWIAGRYEQWPESGNSIVKNAFPDEYNDEFSRDLEPSKGQLRDNYYYQLCYYVRKYKGCVEQEKASAAKTVSLSGAADQWNDVGPYYVAYPNNTFDRNAKGYGSYYYTDKTGRNDIIGARVARDAKNLYFCVECQNDITPYTDPLWMNLYIDSVTDEWGWESFDYVVGKKPASKDKAYLEKFTGEGYETEDVCEIDYAVNGKTLVMSVPKSALGINGEDYTVNFKWTDNVQDEDGSGAFKGEILDFYRTGDVAPGGRFKYSFIATAANSTPAQTSQVTQGGVTGPVSDIEETDGVNDKPADTQKPADDNGAPGMSPVVIAIIAVAAAAAVTAVVLVIVKSKKKK